MIKEVPRGVLPIWKFGTKELGRYSLTGVYASGPKTGTRRFEASDGKVLCRIDVTGGDTPQPIVAQDKGILIPCPLWRKVAKTSRSGTGSRMFDILYEDGKLGKHVTLTWMEKDISMTAMNSIIDGSFPDVGAIIENVKDEPVKNGIYDPTKLGHAIGVIEEVAKGFSSKATLAIKMLSFQDSGIAIKASGDNWKLIVILQGLTKDVKI